MINFIFVWQGRRAEKEGGKEEEEEREVVDEAAVQTLNPEA